MPAGGGSITIAVGSTTMLPNEVGRADALLVACSSYSRMALTLCSVTAWYWRSEAS
ncbi:hypothetical protein JOD54_001699 [Actinokineospora baliensis]|uniref:hypothetical protein n=1 Tax=Actinokineospora baliensis TaxID=547056 RepID=UPI001958F6FB|nr:hypothetical protein [Actinokineospora baliensis]MBM7771495.1 hypothetical protein [Actinokineospora baliensis]